MKGIFQSYESLMKDFANHQSRSTQTLRALRDLPPIEVGLSEKDCVRSEGKVSLYHYRPLSRAAKARPLLICYAMVNRPYLLDLQPDRSMIRALLNLGIDVYLIDWGYPDSADRFTGLGEYILGYLHRCVDHIRAAHEIESLNLLGVCQGGSLSLCYAALEPERIENLVTMVTPVDFKTPENLLSKWAKHLDVELMTRTGNVSGEFLNMVFLALMPFKLTQQKYVRLLLEQNDRRRLENFMRMEKWIFDSPDQPATAFKEFVEWFFQDNRLVRGGLELEGRAVDLKNITQPVLNLYATRDHLVPPSASTPLGAHVGSKNYQSIAIDTGHIGMYVSSKAQHTVPEAIAQWLTRRDGMVRAASARARAKQKSSKRKNAPNGRPVGS